MRMRLIFGIVLAMIVLVGPSAPLAADTTVIKLAVVMPEGSTWTNTIHQYAAAVKKQTGGQVAVKVYAGGISGDEADVLRKMRVNRIHAAGFSGVGLGIVLPEIRILEAPLLCGSYAEVDYLKQQLYDHFAAGFEKKGYVLLGFAEAGFVYLFSEKDMTRPGGLDAVKMWAWKGDPVAETFLANFGIRTFPLNVTDVNTGLETGMIDSFYAPPLAAVAFQWYARIKYMLDCPMVNSTGALLIKKSVFDRLSAENQQILRTLTRNYCRELVRLTRRDNREAMQVLRETGIEFVRPGSEQVADFRQKAAQTWGQNIPGLYSRQLFDRVQALLADYRNQTGAVKK